VQHGAAFVRDALEPGAAPVRGAYGTLYPRSRIEVVVRCCVTPERASQRRVMLSSM